MFNLIGAVISGLVVGILARFFYPGTVPLGFLLTVLLGVAGSILASLVAGAASGRSYRGGVNRAGCLASVLGAMVLIFIGRHFL